MKSPSPAAPIVAINTIVVGGGHAGVNFACMLELSKQQQQQHNDYLILERADSLLSKWRNMRWDHFQLNTPVKFSRLHGQEQHDDREDWLLDRPIAQDLQYWDAHIDKLHIPSKAKLKANVLSVTPLEDGTFETLVETQDNNDTSETTICCYHSKNVVVCNGVYDHNKVPSHLAQSLPSFVKQHVTGGFRLDDLIPGNVLVVGASQSGVQLSSILVEHANKNDDDDNRIIYLACSGAGGCPRTFRGHDVFYWFHRMKFLYITTESLQDMPAEKAHALRYGTTGSPITGPNRAISPFSLERQGVRLTGRLQGVQQHNTAETESLSYSLEFANDRCSSLQAALDGNAKIVAMLRDFCNKLDDDKEELPPEIPEPEWQLSKEQQETLLTTDPGPLSLDLKESGITNVIWATGWAPNLEWLKIDQEHESAEFDKRTKLPTKIVSKQHPGLFFLGYPWLSTIQSLNLVAMDPDAKIALEHLRT